jgi:putative Holliday junction resolvase
MKDMLADIAATHGPLVGLDVGVKTIGVALSDPSRSLATPVETIKRSKFTEDAQKIVDFAASRRAVGIILGLPRNMDGSDGPKVQSVKTFAKNLGRLTPLPVGFWDERLSTAAAERELLALDVSRKKRAAVIDAHAASFILQGALDRLRQNQKTGGA